MSTVIQFPLYNATKSALQKFRTHLPNGVFTEMDDPNTERAFVEEWAAALIGVTMDAILDAASRWLRDPDKIDRGDRTRIPTIAGFALYARNIDFEHYRPKLVLTPQRPANAGTAHQREALQRRAEAALGSRELAQEVWGMLWQLASSSQRRQAVRDGDVSLEDFDDAIAMVRESNRVAKRPA